MLDEKEEKKRAKMPRKITKQRLKNIALYYLKRFDSSVENLRMVLKRRIDKYAYYDSEFDKSNALEWVDQVLEEIKGYGYLDDERYADIKVKNYLAAGKSSRYIKNKLKEKGVSEGIALQILEDSGYDDFELAFKFAAKKKIGPFRADELRAEFWQKDMLKLVQAGFDYEIAQKVIKAEN